MSWAMMTRTGSALALLALASTLACAAPAADDVGTQSGEEEFVSSAADVDQLLVRAGAVGGKLPYACLAHAGRARLDLSHLRRVRPDQGRDFSGLEPCGLAKLSQLGPQTYLTSSGLPPSGHDLIPCLNCLEAVTRSRADYWDSLHGYKFLPYRQ